MKRIFLLILLAAAFIPSGALSFTATGFQNPYGVVVDDETGYIYVSNINGGYDLQDGNGFISRLNKDGTVETMRYIGGGSGETTLNSPKGMAILDYRLYVADINKLRVYDLKKGRLLYNINFGDFLIKHLMSITVGADMALYVTDGPANTIYRIDPAKQHEVTVFASGEFLGQPHGICWYQARELFIVTGWASGGLIEFDKGGKQQMLPAVLVNTIEGCTTDGSGNIYISSESLDIVFRIDPNFALFGFALGQQGPAGITFRKSDNQLMIVSLDSNTVQSFPAQP